MKDHTDTQRSFHFGHVRLRNPRLLTVMALLAMVLLTTFAWGQKQPQPQPRRMDTATATPQDTRHHEATLTDATGLYRVCSTRPSRVLPTQGSKTERTVGPCGFLRRPIVKPLHFLHDGRQRRETAPFCLSASCLYYVIALRHIIR